MHTVLKEVDDRIINMSEQLEAEIRDVRTALILFAKLYALFKEIMGTLTQSMYFYTTFQVQLQAVAMQRLTPSTIPASVLRDMLLQIEDRLPKTVGLPRDPRTHLFI